MKNTNSVVKKLLSILCVVLMVSVVFSTAVTNVSACGGGGGEKEIESLNPDVATNDYVQYLMVL